MNQSNWCWKWVKVIFFVENEHNKLGIIFTLDYRLTCVEFDRCPIFQFAHQCVGMILWIYIVCMCVHVCAFLHVRDLWICFKLNRCKWKNIADWNIAVDDQWKILSGKVPNINESFILFINRMNHFLDGSDFVQNNALLTGAWCGY